MIDDTIFSGCVSDIIGCNSVEAGEFEQARILRVILAPPMNEMTLGCMGFGSVGFGYSIRLLIVSEVKYG